MIQKALVKGAKTLAFPDPSIVSEDKIQYFYLFYQRINTNYLEATVAASKRLVPFQYKYVRISKEMLNI